MTRFKDSETKPRLAKREVRKTLLVAVGLLFILLSSTCVWVLWMRVSTQGETIQGVVLNSAGSPIEGAVVRVQNSEIFTITGSQGTFALSDAPASPVFNITAWSPGYYISGVYDVQPGVTDLEIELEAHTDIDHAEYAWLPSVNLAGDDGEQGCAECHQSGISPIGQDEDGLAQSSLPVDEWLLDAHSQTTRNIIFLTMYAGTNVNGDHSPLTEYIVNRDYGRIPMKPDSNQAYYGPGYKLDFPYTDGNCAACHAPTAAVNNAYGVDPTTVQGVFAEGISCDFCHKIWDVTLDPQSGLPFPNMVGVLSYEFRRPAEGHQFFAGPLDDVAPGEDTYLPLQQQSQFCAGCHFGQFWGTQVYNSFGEWLESPYSDSETGQSCQDCHMPSLGATEFALATAGGLTRDPQTIFSHRMPGASDETLLQNAVTMRSLARRDGETIIVEVTIINDQTGHHVPTDSPLRQMILLVQAKGSNGESLEMIDGSTVPEWGGLGDPSQGYYAGLPGKGFAKILMEKWTEVSPTGAYWNPTRIVSDNRIAAFGSDTSTYTFTMPDSGSATITVTLLFRRAFIELMDLKEWEIPDIVMERQTVVID